VGDVDGTTGAAECGRRGAHAVDGAVTLRTEACPFVPGQGVWDEGPATPPVFFIHQFRIHVHIKFGGTIRGWASFALLVSLSKVCDLLIKEGFV